MTTTNMFLNFGGKWDSPPLEEKVKDGRVKDGRVKNVIIYTNFLLLHVL